MPPRRDMKLDHFEIRYTTGERSPFRYRHPVTGRTYHRDDPVLTRLGIYVRRARRFAGRSQQSVADEIGIPQSQISRLERALAPSMDVERLGWIDAVLRGAFPLGYCPHVHQCRWQPLTPRTPPRPMTPVDMEAEGRLIMFEAGLDDDFEIDSEEEGALDGE